jgi:spore coat protein JB
MPSCPQKPSSDCSALLRRLQVLDFSIVDTVLYLDAYPHSAEALAHYRKLTAERGELIRKLSEDCHRPMTTLDNGNGDAWHWTDGPWPWDPSAN